MKVEIDSDGEFLRVKVSGRKDDVPPSQVCAAVLKESATRGINQILIELDQDAPLSSASQHQLVTRLPSLGLTHRHRIALVHRTPEMQEANEFINLLAENRGIPVRNFREVERAVDWLRQGANHRA